VQEERNACRVELAAANDRLDAGLAELQQVRRECADLRAQVTTLQAYHSGP
jgi:hypothetical protein